MASEGTGGSPLELHGFETSNNFKARIALGYKGIPYRFHSIDPADREPIQKLSGQSLTPVLQHGEVVLFDSAAILRYLEANFRGTPRLFGASVAEQWEIEDWEFFARTQLAGPMLELVHNKISGKPVDDAMVARCTAAFHQATDRLAERLSGREWLVGEAMSAADIAAAPVLFRVRGAEIFSMPDSATTISGWEERVMSFDGPSRVR